VLRCKVSKKLFPPNDLAMNSSSPITLNRDCESIEIPSGLQKTLSSGTVVRVLQSRGGSYTVSTSWGAMHRIDAKDADALGLTTPRSATTVPAGPLTKQMVLDQLKTVFDPEIPVNIVDLGLVYGHKITALESGENRIDVKMTMTAPGCGMGNVLKADVENRLSRLPDVKEVHVELVFEPPWHAGLMTDAARLQLGLDLDEGPSPFPVFQSNR
jgi:probable FeS assembly SUF system protein SufT